MKRPSRRTSLSFLLAFRSLRSAAAGMVTLAFPYLLLGDIRQSPMALGFIYAAAAVATAALGLCCGVLADVWGRKKTLVLVGAFLPLGCLITYLSRRVSWVAAAAMIGGFSASGSLAGGGVGGAVQPIQSALIADLTDPGERTFYFSMFAFIAGFVAALGIFLTRFFSTRNDFLAAAAISALGLLGLAPLTTKDPVGSVTRMRGRRRIGQFAATGILNGFSQGLIAPFLIPFFIIAYHVPRPRMAAYGSAAGLLGAAAMLFAPALDKKFGFVRGVAWTRGLGALLLVLLPLQKSLIAALLIYLLTPALRVAAIPAQKTALTEWVPAEERGRALAINQLSRLGSSSAGTALTGTLFSLEDIGLPFYLYGVVMSLNIGLYFYFFGPNGRWTAPSDPIQRES